MARRDQTLISWLLERGEARFTQLAEELLTNPTLAEGLTGALRRAARTKGQVDRNMQMLLGLLNMPSKADYNRLLSKIESLQGSLVNLNIKLDRLLAERERPRRRRSDKPQAASGHS